MEDIKAVFADNLRRMRKDAGLTQQNLGMAVGYTEKTVSKWESGKAIPDAETLLKLSDTLDTDLYTLLGRTRVVRFCLGIDGGGTGTKFALADETGTVRSTLTLDACNPVDIGIDASLAVLERGIRQISKGISLSDVAVYAGIAGLASGGFAEVYRAFFKRLGFGKFAVDSDMATAIEVCLHGGDGTAVIAGTGSVICVMQNGGMTRIGGYGYLFDRALCGYTVAAMGFEAVLHALDGSASQTALSERFAARCGGDVRGHLGALYKGGKAYIASFAPLVFEAYAAGDAVACEIITTCVRELARQIAAGVQMLDVSKRRVCMVGGMTAYADAVLPLLRACPMPEGTVFAVCTETPVSGAVRLAMRLAGLADAAAANL